MALILWIEQVEVNDGFRGVRIDDDEFEVGDHKGGGASEFVGMGRAEFTGKGDGTDPADDDEGEGW